MIRLLAFLVAFAAATLGTWKYRSAQLGDEDLLPLAKLPDSAGQWVASAASGQVQRLSADGEWIALAEGDALSLGEQVKTGPNGKATLRGDTGAELVLSSSSHVTLRNATLASARFRCSQGHLTVDGKGAQIFVELRPADARASSEGRFSVLCSAERAFVHGRAGDVTLASTGKTLTVKVGELATVAAGATDFPVKTLEPDLAIEVAEPKRENQVAVVTGTVNPASRVFVGAVPASVDGEGKFTARVPLRAGENRFSVTATDIAGREKTLALAPIAVTASAAPPPGPSLIRPTSSGKPKGGGGFQWGVKK